MMLSKSVKQVFSYFDRRQPHLVSFRQQIEKRAYELWQEAGSPDGKDIHFWTMAERELWSKYGNKIPPALLA
jgi:hypothetical protein